MELPLVPPWDIAPWTRAGLSEQAWLAREEKRQARLQARRARAAELAHQEEEYGRFLVLKSQLVRGRLEAHGLPRDYLGGLSLSLVVFSHLESWLGRPNEVQHWDRARAWAEGAARAALANPFVQAHLAASPAWSTEGVRRDPPVRLRFVEASAVGTLGACLEATRHKSWGDFVALEYLSADVEVLDKNVGYLYHASSRYNRRFEQRKAMKRLLGRVHRELVKRAFGSTKKEFLAQITDHETRRIAWALGVNPGTFWRAAKGRHQLELPSAPIQQLIPFPEEPE